MTIQAESTPTRQPSLLPTDAVRPPPQGQLGLGASYFAANGNSANNAALFLKQAFVRFKPRRRFGTQSLTIGRLEYNDGAEVAPSNGTLAALKRERISQRLIGSFAFSDRGRSVDGAEYTLSTRTLKVTALAGRPTQGVFDVDGWPELRVNLFYGALTKQIGYRRAPAEWRIFGLGYDDYRHLAGKADNRPPTARNGDTSSIAVATIGGHYLQAVETHAGPIDILGWAAIQSGSWGTLTHRAVAFAAEGGWQPQAARTIALWIRGGYDYGSGDADPGDRTHGTFFQVLPTPRVYARLPFFNMMNSSDAFAALILKPMSRLIARTDVHSIGLADAHDLWYSGGGAFEAGSFGYAGRPSSGHSKLATLTDVSVDWTVHAQVTLTGYYGWARGGPVSRAIYSNDGAARFGYVEALVRF